MNSWWLGLAALVLLALAAGSMRAGMLAREERIREQAQHASECAKRGGHYHCPYRADCLCLAPGMVVP